MLKLEFKRYLFSKGTVVFLVVITAINAVSWGSSLYEQSMLLEQNLRFTVESGGDSLYIVYNGWTFLYNLWFNSGTAPMTIYFVYAWLGVVLTSRLFVEQANRFGNLVITRQRYKKRFHTILLAQSLYIMTLVGAYILISVIGSLVLGGIPTEATPVGVAVYGWREWVGISILQFLWLSIAFISVNSFCLLLNQWIKQKHLLQLLPFFLFVIVPAILWSTTFNLAPALFNFVSNFNNTEMTMDALGFFFQDWGLGHFLRSAQTAITTIIFSAILYPFHLRKGAKDYL